MTERSNLNFFEKRINRRLFLQGATIGALSAYRKLNEGISGAEPKIKPQEYDLKYGDVALWEQSKINASAYSSNTNQIIDKSSESIIQQEELKYAHRSGNRIESIDKAFEKGVQVFDIDLNNVNGVLYGDHGYVPSIKLWELKLYLPLVIDISPDERKLKLGRPKYTFAKLASRLGELTSDNHPLFISAELKRGDFGTNEMNSIFQILSVNNLGGVVRPRSYQQFEIARNVLKMQENTSFALRYGEMTEGTELTVPQRVI